MRKWQLIESFPGYITAEDETKAAPSYMRAGSQNVLVSREKKAGIRPGFTFALEGGESDDPCVSGRNWKNSTGGNIPWRMDDDGTNGVLRAYFGTVDGIAQSTWATLKSDLDENYPLRGAMWYDAAESIDVMLWVNHSDVVYEWSGAAASASSAGANTLVKLGTTTWAQNRFYAEAITDAGDDTTRFDITNTAGTTFRYTYDGTGTDPAITATSCPVGTWVYIGATGFNAANTGVFLVTASAANYFEVTNASGVVESNVTVGTNNKLYFKFKKVVQNTRTGMHYGYLGGESTTTLTSVLPDAAGAVNANDLFVQAPIPHANLPEDGYDIDNIFSYQNNVFFSSDADNRVLMSQNSDYETFTPSSPRTAGQGSTFTLDDPGAKFGVIGKQVVMLAGDAAYLPKFEQIAVGAGVAETIIVEKRSFGQNQGAYSQETVIQVDDAIAFLSSEPALRLYESVEQITDRTIKALSNPIKPDFDDENWVGAVGSWHGSRILLHSRANSRLYMLEWVETPDGGVTRFWQPPQILPIGAFAEDSGYLYAFSSADGKSMLPFNGESDYVYDFGASEASKVPIDARMKLAYNSFGKRGNLKCFDEMFVEGEISQNCDDLLLQVEYDFGGATAVNEQLIDGSDLSIILETIEATSIGQQSLGAEPLGGALESPAVGSHFQTILEYAKEDFYLLGINFSTNEIDRTWTISAVGPNAQLSNRIRR
jgi:hypothetical protein